MHLNIACAVFPTDLCFIDALIAGQVARNTAAASGAGNTASSTASVSVIAEEVTKQQMVSAEIALRSAQEHERVMSVIMFNDLHKLNNTVSILTNVSVFYLL